MLIDALVLSEKVFTLYFLRQFSVFFVWAKPSFVIIYANTIHYSTENKAEDGLSNFLFRHRIYFLFSIVNRIYKKKAGT